MATKKWKEVRGSRSPEVLQPARRKTAVLSAALQLSELRHRRGLTQQQLAERLGADQSGVSRLEKRKNLQLDTLREVIEALGGEMEITARFPDGETIEVRI